MRLAQIYFARVAATRPAGDDQALAALALPGILATFVEPDPDYAPAFYPAPGSTRSCTSAVG